MAARAQIAAKEHKSGARQKAASVGKGARKPATPRKKMNAQGANAADENLRELVTTTAPPVVFNGQEIQVMLHEGDPWFIANELCAVLEHSNSRVAVARLDDDEKGVTSAYTLGGKQKVKVVNESGLYSLIFTSKKPQAKAFRRWVTTEVLPSIRRTGSYKAATEAEATKEIRPFLVDLPGPGRYVIMAVDGRTAHVRRTEYDAMFAEDDALDRQLMAGALMTTAAYWHKLQQRQAVGAFRAEALILAKLERAILDGSNLGSDCLHVLSFQRGERIDEGA